MANSIKYNGATGLSKLLTLLKNMFDTKVDKDGNKVLSTNDFTTDLKSKLEGLNNYTHPSSTNGGNKTSGLYKITTDANGHVASAESVQKADITGLGIPGQDTTYSTGTATAAGITKLYTGTGANTDGTMTQAAIQSALSNKADSSDIPTVPTISTNIDTDSNDDAKTASPKAVKDYVDATVSSTYKPAGSAADVASLPALSKANLGKVVNMTAGFTSTADFVEGAGNTYPAGTNVVVVNPSGTTYKYDVLAGFVDLSSYAKTEDYSEFTADEIQAEWDKVFTTSA